MLWFAVKYLDVSSDYPGGHVRRVAKPKIADSLQPSGVSRCLGDNTAAATSRWDNDALFRLAYYELLSASWKWLSACQRNIQIRLLSFLPVSFTI